MKNMKTFLSITLSFACLVGLMVLAGCGEDDGSSPSGVTANAGPDLTITLGETATLNGSGADAAGGTLNYIWVISGRPTGSTAIVDNSTSAIAQFTPDVIGAYTAQLTVASSTGAVVMDEALITVEQGVAPEEIGGTISTNTTLVNRIANPALPDYVASSDVIVNAVLTIEPGVMIEFEDDEGLAVSTSGTLIAIGTGAEKITFTGVEKTIGFWKGIEIESNDSQNELNHSTVEYGGKSGFDGANLKSNLMVQGSGKVKVSNSSFTHSGGYGIYTRSLESDLPQFADNTITMNKAPIMTSINHYHYYDVGSDYTGNDDDYIDSYWGNDDVESDVTWNALNVPYRMANNVETIIADVTILPGAQFLGQPNGGIEVISSGSLNAVGTSSNKIVFKGEQDVDGYWKGLSIESNNTSNEFTYVEVTNGGEEGFDGANIKTNIMVDGSGRLKMTNSKSSKSGGYGLYTRALESSLPGFANNILTDNVAPVATRVNHYHYFDSNSDFTGNDDDYIDSYWSNKDVTSNNTWNALNVPYRMAANVEDIAATITIQAGANFIGQPNGGFRVISGGSLKADGTASNRISFKGEQDVSGYWKGLRFMSNSANNSFDNVIISNGGEEGFDGGNRKANIEISNGGLFSITNSTISKSGGNGIRVQSGGTLSQSGLTFSEIPGTNILVD